MAAIEALAAGFSSSHARSGSRLERNVRFAGFRRASRGRARRTKANSWPEARPAVRPAKYAADMAASQQLLDRLKEDVTVIGDTLSVVVEHLESHDAHLIKID